MRILIISYYYPPIRSVASERLYCFAKYLSELGNDVEVLTCDNGQPFTNDLADVNVIRIRSRVLAYIEHRFADLKSDSGKMTEGKRTDGFITRKLRKINAFRIKRGLGYLGRMPDVTDFWYLAARQWLKRQSGWDCVIASYAPYSSLMLGLYAKKQGKCAILVSDFRDLWTRHHLFPGLFPFTRIEKTQERKVIGNSDLVTTVSAELAGEIRKLYPSANTAVIPNGYRPLHDLAPTSITIPGKARYKILHTGSLYPAQQNLEPLFTAMRNLAHGDETQAGTFSLIFAGANREAVENLAAQYELRDQVIHIGFVGIEEARALQQQADLLLYIDYRNLSYDGLVPVKLYEYAAAGKPVVFLRERETSNATAFLKECGTGLFVDNNAESIQTVLSGIGNVTLEMPGPPDQHFVEQFSRDRVAGQLNNLITKLLDNLSGKESGG